MAHRLGVVVLCALAAVRAPAQQMAHGTALALVRTDDAIVVAADSRVSDGDGRALPDQCKILGRSGGLYFSLIGLTTFRGAKLAEVVDRSLRSPGSVAERVQSIRLALAPMLDHALQTDGAVRAFAAGHGSVMGVVVYGQDGEELVVHHVRFALRDARHVDPQVHVCPGADCRDGRVVITAPVNEKTFDWSLPAATAARQWVQAEIDKGNGDIGGPLQLMMIDRSGEVKWVERPKVCKGTK